MKQVWPNQYLYVFPLFAFINKLLNNTESEQVQRIVTHTHLAVTGVVLNSFENVNRKATFLSQQQQFLSNRHHGAHPLVKTYFSGLLVWMVIDKCYLRKELLTCKLITSSRRLC